VGDWVDDAGAALVTDLYELTMAAAYHGRGMLAPATFELVVRSLPPERGFLVACGLEQALDYLETLRFDADALSYLGSLGLFTDAFLADLGTLRFAGDVWAVPEGEVVFAGQPLLTLTAPLVEAQVVETFLLTTLTFQTMVASKAARVAVACGDRTFVDFSGRRDHGPDAAVKSARAAYVGGAAATSNVLAGKLFGIPVTGTMAHSFVMAFDDEAAAFVAFARTFPERAVLLIDTYDTEEGARRAVRAAGELAGDGISVQAVRLDSGDLAALAPAVRRILDDAGLRDVEVFASGDLDEHRIAALLGAGAPIDAFGVGTRLGTSMDAPSLNTVYKLVADAAGPKMKRSEGKATLPGRKQVYRSADHDVLALADERMDGRPLLAQVMAGGRRVDGHEALDVARARRADAVAALPLELRALDGPYPRWAVERSPGLMRLVSELEGRRG